jgi:hypothetical protein
VLEVKYFAVEDYWGKLKKIVKMNQRVLLLQLVSIVLVSLIVTAQSNRISFMDENSNTEEENQRRLQSYHPLVQHCRDKGEAYGAAFLVRKDFFMSTIEKFTLARTRSMFGSDIRDLYEGELWLNRRQEMLKKSNVELATFSMMSHVTDLLLNETGNAYQGGRLYQSIDVLDFSVLHLSTYERLLHRYSEHKNVHMELENYSPIEEATEMLKAKGIFRSQGRKRDLQGGKHRMSNAASPYFQRTVVVMPYLGYEKGEGNSKTIYRQRYLAACFWSFYAYYPFIVIAVTSAKDRDYILKESGLPVFDVMFMPDLPFPAALPLASVLGTARKLYVSNPKSDAEGESTSGHDDVTGTNPMMRKAKRRLWKQQFEYIFYTESDQMLVIRSEERMVKMYEAIQKDPNRRWDQDFMLSPHRLAVYPEAVLQNIYKFPPTALSVIPYIPVRSKDGEILSQFSLPKPVSVTGPSIHRSKTLTQETLNGATTVATATDFASPKQSQPSTTSISVTFSTSQALKQQQQLSPTIEWQCCQQASQMCRRPREHWAVLTANSERLKQNPYRTSPSLISLFHRKLYVALGNVDFHYERFHGCHLSGIVQRDLTKPLICPYE